MFPCLLSLMFPGFPPCLPLVLSYAVTLTLMTILVWHLPVALEYQEVTRATTLARLLFAAPAWWGFALALDRERLQRFLNKAIRMGYLSTNSPYFSDMVAVAEDGLLSTVFLNLFHVLRPSFPPILSRRPGLRKRAHPFKLHVPLKDDKNYIYRILYRFLI